MPWLELCSHFASDAPTGAHREAIAISQPYAVELRCHDGKADDSLWANLTKRRRFNFVDLGASFAESLRLDGTPCRFPQIALPLWSFEAGGIDRYVNGVQM